MIIEFNTSYKLVSEDLVNNIRKQILDLSHNNKRISRAEVLLKEVKSAVGKEDKICEIKLESSDGGEVVAHARTDNFEESAKEAITQLKKLADQQVKKQHDLPDIIISTVKV